MRSKLKLLVIGINYTPDLIGIAKYTTELCEELTRRGHEVEAVTAPPYYPDWRIPDEYRGRRRRREVLNGVSIWRAPIYVPATPSGFSRLLHLASFAISSLPLALTRAAKLRPDHVLCVAPAMFSAPAALVAARFAGAKSWLHVQDFELDAAFELGLLRGRAARGVGERIERALLRRFDLVSTISPKMVERLRAKGVPPGRALEIRNWVNVNEIRPEVSSDTPLRRELGIAQDTLILLYSGNMAAKQGLEVIAQAAESIETARPGAMFLLVGNGPLRSRLEALCQARKNVRFMDLQPTDRVAEVLASADVHLLPQRIEAADLVLPSKLAPMLSSGRPIAAMAPAGSSLAQELEGAGLATDPADPDAWIAAITRLIDDPLQRRQLGAGGRIKALKRWNRESVLDQIETALLSDLERPF